MMDRDVFPNFVEILSYIGNETLRSWMFALDLLENFDRRPVWINFLGRFGKRFLLGF